MNVDVVLGLIHRPSIWSSRVFPHFFENNLVHTDVVFHVRKIDQNGAILIDDEGVLAITSSTWFKVQCEEKGIVLGGGALKLDAIQLKKMLFPSFSTKEIEQLNKLGRELSSTTIDDASEIIKKIDSLFLTSLGIKKNKVQFQKTLTEILDYYINRRLK